MTNEEYLNLITSAFRDKPKFMATIEALIAVPVRVQALLLAMMTTKFDIDLAAGDQLDILGQWVGVSRNVNIPIADVYFSWDGTTFTGWEYGVWQPTQQPANVTVLPDDVYRNLLKGKIAANQWDGTTTGMYRIWDTLFPNLTILINDNQDMSYDIAFVGAIVDSLTLALIEGGYLQLKPEGVKVNVYYFPVDTNPLFGWDIESAYVQGWDQGSWARET